MSLRYCLCGVCGLFSAGLFKKFLRGPLCGLVNIRQTLSGSPDFYLGGQAHHKKLDRHSIAKPQGKSQHLGDTAVSLNVSNSILQGRFSPLNSPEVIPQIVLESCPENSRLPLWLCSSGCSKLSSKSTVVQN